MIQDEWLRQEMDDIRAGKSQPVRIYRMLRGPFEGSTGYTWGVFAGVLLVFCIAGMYQVAKSNPQMVAMAVADIKNMTLVP